MSESLVRRTSFVSPIYEDRLGTGEIGEGKLGDERDKFPEWFEQNSLQGGIFVGENGVQAEIHHHKKYTENCRPNVIFKTQEDEYQRHVDVSYMPASREIPRELRKILSNFCYQEVEV